MQNVNKQNNYGNNNTNIQEDKVDELILNYLNTPKFQTSLNSLIISTLSNRKNMALSRKGIADKIISHEYIKDVENEVLQNLFSAFGIDNYNTHELINLKYKNLLQKSTSNQKADVTLMQQSNNSLLNSMMTSSNTNAFRANIDSIKLLNILTEEFLTCNDNLKIENYIGDFSNFEAEILVTYDRIESILDKIDTWLTNNGSSDMFLIPNLINFFSKIIKFTNTKILCKSITIFLNYFNAIVSKFYESSFDITKFYKLSFNVECLNKMIMIFYDNPDIFLRKVDEQILKSMIQKIFDTVMKNYNVNNPVYFSETGVNTSSNSDFGLCTNYILLLFFLLDNNFSLFKVLFRLTSIRKHIIPKFVDSNLIQTLPFVDMVSCINSLNKKFCFLWGHTSVLEKVFSNQKMNKKFLLYCWISIKLHFLGLVLRYKSMRNTFYVNIVEMFPELNCFLHFRNVLALTVDLLVDTKQDFEEYQKENLFYLTKEILCDFILYCNDRECCYKKMELIEEINSKEALKNDKMICYLINDLQLALRDNIYTHNRIGK